MGPGSIGDFWRFLAAFACASVWPVSPARRSADIPVRSSMVRTKLAGNPRHARVRNLLRTGMSALRPTVTEPYGSPAKVLDDGLGPGMHVQLLIDRPHVAAHGINADLHAVGNFLVGVALGELVEEIPFPGR